WSTSHGRRSRSPSPGCSRPRGISPITSAAAGPPPHAKACPRSSRRGCDRPGPSGTRHEAAPPAADTGAHDRGAGDRRADRGLELLAVLLPAPWLRDRLLPAAGTGRPAADHAFLLAGAASRGRLHRLHATRL